MNNNMSGIGYYLKYDEPDSKYGECVFLEYVYDECDNGYCSETYIIRPSSIYYEDASFNGFTLEHLKTAKRVKRQKFNAVKDMMSRCRQELDYLGMTGERVMSPEVKAGDFYYSYSEDIEEGIVEDYFSYYYRIITVDDDLVTCQMHFLTKNNLVHETKIYTKRLEDFLDFEDTRWYKITEELFNIAARKIDFTTKDILKKYRTI
jgi:hypothetical protein